MCLGWHRPPGGEALAARDRGAFSGKPFETLVLATQGTRMAARRAWRSSVSALRRPVRRTRCGGVATAAGLTARGQRLGRIAILMRPWTSVPHDVAAQALAEGALLANYDGASLKTADHDPRWLDDVAIAGLGAGPGVDGGRSRAA